VEKALPAHHYYFREDWHIAAALPEVWWAISRVKTYTEWWKPVYQLAEPLDGDGEPRVGGRTELVARGFLPYTLRFRTETIALDPPQRIEFSASGDFVGRGCWTLRAEANGTVATLEWEPIVEKPGVKQLSFLLKPLFKWNHRWTMKWGERGLRIYLAGRASARR
jgi:hypothetical protein